MGIYRINAITAKQKNLLEALLMPFSIMAKIMFVGQSTLIIASKASNGPLVAIILPTIIVSFSWLFSSTSQLLALGVGFLPNFKSSIQVLCYCLQSAVDTHRISPIH